MTMLMYSTWCLVATKTTVSCEGVTTCRNRCNNTGILSSLRHSRKCNCECGGDGGGGCGWWMWVVDVGGGVNDGNGGCGWWMWVVE